MNMIDRGIVELSRMHTTSWHSRCFESHCTRDLENTIFNMPANIDIDAVLESLTLEEKVDYEIQTIQWPIVSLQSVRG